MLMEQTILFHKDPAASRSGETIRIKPFSNTHSDTFRNVPLTIIAAVGENLELGKRGDLVWHIPADLRHFKQLTMGAAVIMGRKTWDSLRRKPLPGRHNIVVSRNPDFAAEGATRAPSIEEAVALAKGSDAFIIGGESIYRAALPFADRMELTHVIASDSEADTFFPRFEAEEWELLEKSETMSTDDGLKYYFASYKKKQ